MQTFEDSAIKLTFHRTADGLQISVIGSEGTADISVSESWLRDNLGILQRVKEQGRFIPGAELVAHYASRIESAKTADELTKIMKEADLYADLV